MDKNDAVLAIIGAVGGQLHGRTTAQKLAYFGAWEGLLETSFKPHYYGPYSDGVANALTSLVSLGYVRESVTVYGEQTDPWLAQVSGDVKGYSYELTEDGQALLEQIKKESPDEWERLRSLITQVGKTTNLNPGSLSIAAKIHYVLKRLGREQVSVDELIEEAHKYDWNLEENQITDAARLLSSIIGQ